MKLIETPCGGWINAYVVKDATITEDEDGDFTVWAIFIGEQEPFPIAYYFDERANAERYRADFLAQVKAATHD